MSSRLVKKEPAEIQPETFGEKIVTELKALIARKGEIVSRTAESQADLKAFREFKVETQLDLDNLKLVLDEVQTLFKARTAEKEGVTKPINAVLTIIHNIYRMDLDALKACEMELKKKAVDGLRYLTAKQTRLLQEAGTASRAGDIVTARAALVQLPDAVMPQGLNSRKVWKFLVERPELVEDKYLKVVVDEERVAAAIDAGVREIAGVKIYQEEIVSNRRG